MALVNDQEQAYDAAELGKDSLHDHETKGWLSKKLESKYKKKTIKNSIKPNSSIFFKAIKLNKSVLQYIYII